MVVVDHDTGRLVWAGAGHDKPTLQTFFNRLGPERAAKIRLVSAVSPNGSETPRSPRASTQHSASTRFTFVGGRPTRWMLCAGGCGTHSASLVLPVKQPA